MTNLETLDTLPELQKALEQEREAGEGRVRFLEGARENAVARASTAEKERDIARQSADDWKTCAEREIAARQQAERERDGARTEWSITQDQLAVANDERDSERTDRERAEAERDALRQEHDEDQGVIRVWRGRCERAEADNAALSKHIDTACHLLSLGQVERAVSYLRKAGSHEHPGAALLERIRGLDAGNAELFGRCQSAEAERDQERELRRRATDALAGAHEARERAEAERDEARVERHMEWAEKMDALAAVKRTEADNAALLDGIRKAVNQATDLDSPDFCECGGKKGNRHDTTCPLRHVDPLASGDHPGAALLTEVEALREAWGLVRGMFEDLAENGNCADAVFTERENAARVLRAVDAMTVKP